MSDSEDETGRPPRGWKESILANSRPQPAIPAVIVLLLSVMVPVLSLEPGTTPDHTSASVAWLLLPLAILASSGLAIAAGFCSFAPPVIWIAMAAWAMKFTQAGGPMPPYNRFVLFAGMLACGAMIVFQIYRVRTGRFVPTINDPEQHDQGS